MSATVLHLIPCLGRGGGAHAALATSTSLADGAMGHRIASLQAAHPSAIADASARGVEVLDAPAVPDLLEAISEADLVSLHYWNSPELTELLELELPEMRLLVWSHIAGDEPPQVMPAGVVAGADLARATSPRGVGALAGVPVIPPIGDWKRVEGVRRSERDGFNVGYVGDVGSTKLHPRFAEASASIRVPDVRIIVCGTGDAFRGLRHRVAELGAQARFELLGQVEDIGAVMSDLDVFGYPLREAWWSSDLALKEAMHCGVPPVVLADGASDLLVEDGVTGVVVDGIDAYAPAVEALHADPARRRRLGEGAREHARGAWSTEALAPLWAQAYESLMAAPKAPRPPLLEALAAPAGARRLLRGMGGGRKVEAAVDARSGQEAAAADRLIARSGTVVGYMDGGLIDYRRRNPDEYQLALWTGLFFREQGRPALAAAELARARELGCPAARLDAHMTEQVPG